MILLHSSECESVGLIMVGSTAEVNVSLVVHPCSILAGMNFMMSRQCVQFTSTAC